MKKILLSSFLVLGILVNFAGADDVEVILDSSDGSSGFTIKDSGLTTVASIESQGNTYLKGNVGIGTPAPTASLEVKGKAIILDPNNNTFISSGNNVATGNSNTAIGYGALDSNTSGNANTAIGYETLNSNTIGDYNIAIGYRSLNSNTGSDYNIAVGTYSLYNNTGFRNIAIGYYALRDKTSGNDNVAIGYQALRYNGSDSGNTAIGYQSLYNASGANTAVGCQTGLNAGSNNVFLGYLAGYHETGSNKLYIANDEFDENVLIYGEFDKRRVGICTTEPSATLEVAGSILAAGTAGGTPVSGAGTRFMWIPAKSALRAGRVTTAYWDDAYIGDYSFATGLNNMASGNYSTAMGVYTTASGDGSTAMGSYTIANGGASTAMGGETTASGDYSTAMGSSTIASEYYSTAMGRQTTASRNYSTAMGYNTIASGEASTAMGYNITASGMYSTAMGGQTRSSGDYATAMGNGTNAVGSSSTTMGLETVAQSYAEVALGRYNIIKGTPTSWVAGDPLFVVGNGSNPSNRSNALTVLKNGNVGIGTSEPVAKLEVQDDASYSISFRSETTGQSATAIRGICHHTSGTNYGGEFASWGSAGRAIAAYGNASGGSDVNYGGYFVSYGGNGRGLYGSAAHTTGTNYGVYGTSSSSGGYDFYAGGAGTDYGSSSSIRWKKNIIPINNALEKVIKLRGVSFDWDQEHGGEHDIGMIAEEVGEVFPEVVNFEPDGKYASGMDYGRLTTVLVEAIKELKAENNALKNRIQALEAKINK